MPRAAKNVSEIPGADLVHPGLQAIEVLVQPGRDDRLDAGVGELGAELSEQAFDRIPEHPGRRPRDGVHRRRAPAEAVLDGARELLLEQQELDDAFGRDAPVALPVHLERAGRAQHGGPLDVVGRRADVGGGRQQEKVLHVEDARRLVGALEHASEPAEVPALVVGHRRVGHAGEQMAGPLDRREQILRVGPASGVPRNSLIR